MTSEDIYAILASKPHNPHYLNRYWKFIQSRPGVSEKIENHHICPKAKDLFPQYASFKTFPWNKVSLQMREHFIAHWLLWKAYSGSQAQAFKLMCLRSEKKSSKIYQLVKLHHAKIMMVDNPNKDGMQAKAAWEVATPERRIKQAKIMAEMNTLTKSKPKEERMYSCTMCNKVFTRLEHVHHPRKEDPVCGHSCNGKRNGLKSKGKKNRKISEYRKGREPWNKGQKCPQISGEKNGMNNPEAKKKMSVIAKSRRKFTREDGSWTWIYPGDPNYPTTSVTEQVGTISES